MSSHFFVALHRYCTLPGPSHTTCKPLYRFRPYYRRQQVHPIQAARHASTSTTPIQQESFRPQNHYDLFPSSLPAGPPPKGSFHVDPSQLRKEFLQLQAVAHPDRHQGADKAKAEAASARINDAYKTLLNPLARARYLLSLRGVELGEDESIAGSPLEMGGGGGNVDAGFLMDVMEVREAIEEAASKEEIEEMKQKNNERKRKCEDRLDELFRAEDIETARTETVRLGYWVNVATALEAWEKVGDGRVSEHD
ncbi:MAG: hypothetical protein Q9170_002167 [Blastenia crenularia]